ncbi:MAG: two-component regulator propeller domain-containing protein [Crocinitomicaceae bacterium]
MSQSQQKRYTEINYLSHIYIGMKGHIVILFISILVKTYAQEPLFQNLRIQDGLVSNTTYYLHQDRQNQIWVSTDAGLSFFDGTSWKTLDSQSGMSDDEIFEIHEDKRGNLWLSTSNGKPSLIDPLTRKQISTGYSQKIEAHCFLYGFWEDSKGTKWVGDQCEGIYSISSQGKVRKYSFVGRKQGHKISNFFEYDSKLVILSSRGLCHILNDSVVPFSKPFTRFPRGKRIDSLYYIGNNTQLECINSQGHLKWDIPVPNSSEIIHMSQKDKNTLWVGTRNGYYEFDLTKKLFSKLFLEGYSVSCMLKDKEGGLWISTLWNGLFYSAFPQTKHYNKKNGLPMDEATGIFLNNNRMWFGFSYGFYGFLENDSLIIQEMENYKGDGRLRDVYATDHQLTLAFPAVSKIEDEKRIDYFFSAKSIIPCDSGLYIANFMSVIFLTWSEIDLLDHSRRTLSVREKGAFMREKELLDVKSTAFHLSDDTVWVGTNSGVLSLPKRKKTLLEGVKITDIKGKNGDLWIGTYGKGIYRRYKGKLINYSKGLSRYCKKLVLVNPKKIWAITKEGIVQFLIKGEGVRVKQFSEINGLPLGEINAVCEKDGEFWIASKTGLTCFPLDKLGQKYVIPAVSIHRNSKRLLDNSTIVMSYNQNALSLKLNCPTFKGKPRFQYQINKSGKWITLKSDELNLSAIEPGPHKIQIRAAGYNNSFSPISELNIEITPPFWLSWQFFAILLFPVGLIVTFFRYGILNFNNAPFKKIIAKLKAPFNKEKHVTVKDVKNGALCPVPIHSIKYVRGSNNYVEIICVERNKILVRSTMKSIYKKLNEQGEFYRIHQSYIINPQHLTGITKQNLYITDEELPIGRSYSDEVIQMRRSLKLER